MNAVKSVLISSADRIYGTSHQFRVAIPPLNDVGRVRLLSASIPNTLYNISAANNSVYWSRGGVNYSAIIQPGAYSVAALIGALTTAMTAVDPGAVYSAAYSPTFMTFTIAADQAIILRTTITASAIWDVIGFDTAADTAALTSHTGTGIVRLDFPAYLLIRIDEVRPLATITTSNAYSNFVAFMSHNSQYIEMTNEKSAFDNVSLPLEIRSGISHLTISLLKPDGSPADLNGANWSMLLGLCYDWSSN